MEDDELFGNRILYRMCEDQPRHSDVDVISGKMWLIGRAYSASIERGSGPHKSIDKFYAAVAQEIARSDLDAWLETIPNEVVRLDCLSRLLTVHANFVGLLKTLTKRNRPSFASKYLHFHRPSAFFIYDSQAVEKIKSLIPGRTRRRPPSTCSSYNPDYANFALRCIQYRDEKAVRDGTAPLSPRQLDRELLGY